MVAWEKNLRAWKTKEEKRALERTQMLDERAARFNTFVRNEEARLLQERNKTANKEVKKTKKAKFCCCFFVNAFLRNEEGRLRQETNKILCSCFSFIFSTLVRK